MRYLMAKSYGGTLERALALTASGFPESWLDGSGFLFWLLIV
jgi:hypothetical protein